MKYFAVVLLLVVTLSLIFPEIETRQLRRRKVQKTSSKGKSKSISIDYEQLGKQTEKAQKRSAKQELVVRKVYDSMIWPRSAQIAVAIEAGNYSAVSDMMTADIQGRIAPLGRFDTYVLTGEYFYGLAGPLPNVPTTGRNRVTSVLFTRIFCSENQCSFRMVATLRDFATNNSIQNYTHLGYANFNSNNQMCSYDVTFLGLSRRDAPESTAARNATINSLCNGILASCNTPETQQYDNFTDCYNFMKSIPYGGWGQADQNTQQCRLIHLQLVRASPTTHCPHTGKDGGGKCIFHPESSYHGEPFDDCRDKNYF